AAGTRETSWKARQFHNQPAQSHQHQFLSDLWAQVAKETGGRLQVTTYPQNDNLPGSDPGALDLLQSGELEFFTLMGGILGRKVPVGQMFRDVFTALEARPVTINIRELYAALKSRQVDGQENPLVITEVNRLYEVTKYVSTTNHIWSGFNLLANLKFWNSLPGDV